MRDRSRVTVVFTPPPTPNGGLHVGHVGGPYLRADLFVRLQRVLGRQQVEHVTHIDSYQSYVAKRAAELSRTPSDVLADNCAQLHSDFESFGIQHSQLGDNTDPAYLRFLGRVVRFLEQRLPLVVVEVPWCSCCGRTMVESYAKGTCPTCLHDAYVNVCENCSMPQLGVSMDVSCTGCDSIGDDVRGVTVLDLGQEIVRDIGAEVVDACSDSRRAGTLLADLGPHKVLWSYSSEYGVVPEGGSQALNPWVEIFCHHLYCLLQIHDVDTEAEIPEQVARLNDAAPAIGYFAGVDNTYYYVFLFTLLARALGAMPMIPRQVKTNPFMLLDGAKVSSSRGNAVWAKDIAGTASVAVLRTGLARSCPEYSPREYRPLPMSSPDVPGSAREFPQVGVPVRSVEAVRLRLEALATMERFNVEDLINTLDKASRRIHELRVNDPVNAEASLLAHYLTEVREQLQLV